MIKKLIQHISSFAFIIFFVTSVSSAQKIPVQVKRTFNQKFHQAEQARWKNESEDEFDEVGNWKETEVEISNEKLPEAIKGSLNSDFENSEIENVYQVTTPPNKCYMKLLLNPKKGIRKSMNKKRMKKE